MQTPKDWTEGFKAGFAAGFGDGYQEGLAVGRAETYADAKAACKQAKYEAKQRKYQAKQEAKPHKKARKAMEATVVGKEQISPDMVRLYVQAPEIIGKELDKTDHYIKIFFVPEGADYSWPFDLAGIRETQPRNLQPVKRTYTLRRVDTRTGEMDIDFVLHGDSGLAGPWARDVEVGEKFGFAGPGGKWAPEARFDHFVFGGDESAAPAIAAGLEQLPANATAVAFVEVEASGHEIPMPEGKGIEVRFIYREGAMPGAKLSNALSTYTPPTENTSWFIHGVAEMVKKLRRCLFVERGIAKQDVSISGYWRLKMTEDEWQASKGEFVAAMEQEETKNLKETVG